VRYFTSTKWWCTRLASRYVFLFLFLASLSASSQVIQSGRYEIPVFESEPNFKLAPAGESGLFLYRTVDAGTANAFQLVLLDTAFREKWAGFVPIENNFVESRTTFYDSSLFVLMRWKDYTKNDFQIAVINQNSGKYYIHTFQNFIPLQITMFKVTHKAAIIGGYFNRVPVVIYYSFAERRSRIAPGLFNDSGELVQIRTYDDDSFDVLVSARNFLRQQTITIRNYDSEGSLIKSISLQPEDNRNLIFGRSLKTYNEMQVVAGVYGNRQSEFSKGIFMASIDPMGNDILQYYGYADLENFFKYMRAKREQRVKDRIERRRIKGRKLRFTYRFIVHELVRYKDQYIMLGEAFYPKYLYSDRSGYGGFFNSNYMGSPRSLYQNGRIFDGYYYTHAVVIGFDQNGKLLWDNSFEINDVRTFELEQFVKLDVRQDHITLLYLYDQKIRTKIINDNEVIEGKANAPIQLRFDTDHVGKNNTESTKLDYWYNHYFLASGIQNVSYTMDGMNLKRRVFFVNKVSHP
jgi:hypothetical protein